MFPADKDVRVLPLASAPPPARPARAWTKVLACAALVCIGVLQLRRPPTALSRDSFFWTSNDASALCPGVQGNASYAGYIGLAGDTADAPRRSFYWLFEAQNDSQNAPVILTIGGGPGSSGLLNPLFGQSHCTVGQNGTVPNPNAWSEHFNVLALDHPIGVGYSYGAGVNNSRDAAHDVYDFLQKFFTVYPQFAGNQFVIASGSYGGTYVPHIATVIHEHNRALAATDARRINLESLMLSNPMSDARSWFTWHLQQACYNTPLYNATQCADAFRVLPDCLERIELAYAQPTAARRHDALEFCNERLLAGDTHGRTLDNVNHKCEGDAISCNPEFGWAIDLLNATDTKRALGVPQALSFAPVNVDVHAAFALNGDHVQQAFRLYEPLLRDGIRVLHYIGKLDAIVGWPSTLSFLRLLDSPFADAFRGEPDVAWPTEDVATVRAIGPGAGNFTLVYMAQAGHFVTKDQPELAKSIVDRWVRNAPWFAV